MKSKITVTIFSIILLSCSSHIYIDARARKSITVEKANAIRDSILSSQEYADFNDLSKRTFQFYLCDESDNVKKDEAAICEIKVWLDESKKFGCSAEVFVNETKNKFTLTTGIVICN